MVSLLTIEARDHKSGGLQMRAVPRERDEPVQTKSFKWWRCIAE